MGTKSLNAVRAIRENDNTIWSVPEMLRHAAEEIEAGEIGEGEMSAVLLVLRDDGEDMFQASYRANATNERRVYMLHCALTSESEAD